MSTTIYDINTRYTLDDRTSKTMVGMGETADRLWGKISRVGAMLAGGFVVQKAKAAFIDFNSELETMTVGMQASIAMNRASTMSFDEAGVAAGGLVDKFQEMAKASPATTKDFVGFADLITGPLLRAGGAIDDIKRATYGGVLGSNVFHIDAEQAARDIESVLSGTLSAKDRFAKALLEPMGYTTASINAMDGKKRLKVLLSALENPALIRAGEKIAGTWKGQWSTLVDNIEMGLGKIGIPLFRAITAEVKRWNDWMEKNKTTVEAMGKRLGTAMVEGFKGLKDGVSFLIDNKATLLQLAQGFLALKTLGGNDGIIAKMTAGTRFAGMGGRIGMAAEMGALGYMTGATGNQGSTALGVGMGALGAASMIPGPQQPFIGGALAVLYVGKLVAEHVEERADVKRGHAIERVLSGAGIWGGKTEERRAAKQLIDKMDAAFKEGGVMPAYLEDDKEKLRPFVDMLRDKNLVNNGQLDAFAYRRFVDGDPIYMNHTGTNTSARTPMMQTALVDEDIAKISRVLMLFTAGEEQASKAAAAEEAAKKKAADRPNKGVGDTNIHIARMEIGSNDPDRFAIGLTRLAQRHTRNRSIARSGLSAGG